jgi:hypothetical protein
LFVAESPPQSSDRYFYFENVKRHDWLWIALMKALYPSEWGYAAQERPRKPQWLTKFQNSGFRLVDAVKEPISGSHRRRVALIKAAAPALIAEIRAIAPDRIVLIKKSVHEALSTIQRGWSSRGQRGNVAFPCCWTAAKFPNWVLPNGKLPQTLVCSNSR